MKLAKLLGLEKKEFTIKGKNGSEKETIISYNELTAEQKNLIDDYLNSQDFSTKAKDFNKLSQSLFNYFSDRYEKIKVTSPDRISIEMRKR